MIGDETNETNLGVWLDIAPSKATRMDHTLATGSMRYVEKAAPKGIWTYSVLDGNTETKKAPFYHDSVFLLRSRVVVSPFSMPCLSRGLGKMRRSL